MVNLDIRNISSNWRLRSLFSIIRKGRSRADAARLLYVMCERVFYDPAMLDIRSRFLDITMNLHDASKAKILSIWGIGNSIESSP
jgi:hypothetical protein